METSFKKNKKEPTTVPDAEVKDAPAAPLAIREERSVAVAPQHSDVKGEFSHKDLQMPRLNIVAKTGELSELFTPGSVVINKEVAIYDSANKDAEPVRVIVLDLEKKYERVNEMGSDEDYEVVDSFEQVKERGGKLVYGKKQADEARSDGQVPFAEIAIIKVLVEAPKGLNEDALALFPFEVGDHAYAPALWTVRSTAYKVAKLLFTARSTHLRDGFRYGVWTLATKKEQNGQLIWFEPVFKTAGKTSEDVVALADTFSA